MAFSIEQIIQGSSEEDVEIELLSLLKDEKIQTTDWKSGSPELTLIKALARGFSKASYVAKQNALNSLNQYSSGSALTLLADSHFDNQRTQGTQTIGNMTVSGAFNVLPKTWQPGELKVTDSTLVFTNQNQITLTNLLPYVTESFIAEFPGSEYNIAANETLRFVNTQVGFGVNNPVNSDSSTWITTFGIDEESDGSLRLRNSTKYTTLSIGEPTEDRVRYIVLSSSNVQYASVDDSQFTTLGVNVYISNATETATSASVFAAQNALNGIGWGNRQGNYITVYAASGTIFDREIQVYYKSTLQDPTLLKDRVFVEADAWISGVNIGGNSYEPFGTNLALVSELVAGLNSVQDVEFVNVVSASTNVTLLNNEKLISPTDWNTTISFVRLTSR